MENAYKLKLTNKRNSLSVISGKICALNPMSVLSRGYSAVFNDKGNVVKKIDEVSVSEPLNIRVSDGSIRANVLSVEKV